MSRTTRGPVRSTKTTISFSGCHARETPNNLPVERTVDSRDGAVVEPRVDVVPPDCRGRVDAASTMAMIAVVGCKGERTGREEDEDGAGGGESGSRSAATAKFGQSNEYEWVSTVFKCSVTFCEPRSALPSSSLPASDDAGEDPSTASAQRLVEAMGRPERA